MTCFETRKHLVDSLDGIAFPENGAVQSHLKACSHCETEHQRLKMLIQILQEQPVAQVPSALRENPIGISLPKRLKKTSLRSLWKSLPVAARLSLEGLSITAVVVLGIQLGPRLRALYEEQMDRRLQKMIAAEDADSEGIPLARTGMDEIEESTIVDSEYEGGEEASSSSYDPSGVQVGKSEVWRFNIKTDSPTLVRAQIIKALREAGISDQTPGFGGLEAPGGIQFDLLIPTSAIPPLKNSLETLAAPATGDLPFSDTFTWYKNRSKKIIPTGQARLVIWLSQI